MTKISQNKSIENVSEFLNTLKNIYCDNNHQLFYRGVSKEQYATPANDHPGIFRKKDYSDPHSEKWVVDEDRMFYDLVARCPEYFKDCKTTFEHLVMMQHYSYPTRLLDITSNPLVALYFACGGLNGVKKSKNNCADDCKNKIVGDNEINGRLIAYKIKKNDIRDYEDIRLQTMTGITKCKHTLHSTLFYLNFELNRIDSTFMPNASDQVTLNNSFKFLINLFFERVITPIQNAIDLLDSQKFSETQLIIYLYIRKKRP